jgi:hypothetical protein
MELIQVCGKQILLQDEVIVYVVDVGLCCVTSSYCFKVYDQLGSRILKQLRFIWGSDLRRLVKLGYALDFDVKALKHKTRPVQWCCECRFISEIHCI